MPGGGPVSSEKGARFSVGFPEESEQKSTPSGPVYWTDQRTSPILSGMETREAFGPRVRREQLVTARLRMATMQLADAEGEILHEHCDTTGRSEENLLRSARSIATREESRP
jgi:hypothetical protein